MTTDGFSDLGGRDNANSGGHSKAGRFQRAEIDEHCSKPKRPSEERKRFSRPSDRALWPVERAVCGLEPRAGSGYPLGVELARVLVQKFPDRCVWGLDWPHPNHTHIPDDGILVNALAHIAPTPESLQALMVDNPARLYRFN